MTFRARRTQRRRPARTARDSPGQPYFLYRKMSDAPLGWRKVGGPYKKWVDAAEARYRIVNAHSLGQEDFNRIERAFYIGQRMPVDRWKRPRPEVQNYERYREEPYIL